MPLQIACAPAIKGSTEGANAAACLYTSVFGSIFVSQWDKAFHAATVHGGISSAPSPLCLPHWQEKCSFKIYTELDCRGFLSLPHVMFPAFGFGAGLQNGKAASGFLPTTWGLPLAFPARPLQQERLGYKLHFKVKCFVSHLSQEVFLYVHLTPLIIFSSWPTFHRDWIYRWQTWQSFLFSVSSSFSLILLPFLCLPTPSFLEASTITEPT